VRSLNSIRLRMAREAARAGAHAVDRGKDAMQQARHPGRRVEREPELPDPFAIYRDGGPEGERVETGKPMTREGKSARHRWDASGSYTGAADPIRRT
jgi:hypothetical protein